MSISSGRVDFEALINDFEHDQNINLLKKHYEEKSMLDILRVSRKESAHSAFLEWILKEDETHKLDQFPIREFLKLIVKRIDKQEQTKKCWENEASLIESIVEGNFKLSEIKVFSEKKEELGRPDLQVHGEISNEVIDKKRFKIIIENKVGALETNNQTERYFREFESNKNEDEVIFYVYLTPISLIALDGLVKPECSCQDFIQINYQLILDCIFEPAVDICQSDELRNTKMIINDYIIALGKPTIDISNTGKDENLVMAITKKESELLTEFYDRHQKIIFAAISAFSEDYNQIEDDRNKAKDAVKGLRATKGDWGIIGTLRNIYDEMEDNEEIPFKDLREKVQEIYMDKRSEAPSDATVNTPLISATVNYTNRGTSSNVFIPFPKNKTLFFIKDNNTAGRSNAYTLKKFIPENKVDDVDINWAEKNIANPRERALNKSKKFRDIRNEFDNSGDYPKWKGKE